MMMTVHFGGKNRHKALREHDHPIKPSRHLGYISAGTHCADGPVIVCLKFMLISKPWERIKQPHAVHILM
jgi:membrane-associated PAP2 superfamily phosphatase